MQLKLIWAQGRGGVIGNAGALPWHLPEDLAHFRTQTQGCPVIMGRKTWGSLPEKFRPLPKRINCVISRQANLSLDGAGVFASLDACLQTLKEYPNVWVIGGAQLYTAALPLAQGLLITEIDNAFTGDAFAPKLDARWRLETQGDWQTSAQGLRYRFLSYSA